MKPAIFIVILLSLTIFSCKKDDTKPDPCANLICLNGGTCNDGVCVCINGYSGQVCQTAPDPCAGITCLNGGYCANGACNCPPGFSGSDCATQVTPKTIKIKSINLTDFPIVDASGGGWDFSSGGDVYLRLYKDGLLIASNSVDKVNNASSAPILWEPLSSDFEFNDTTAPYTLSLYDSDSPDADDFMGGIEFTPYWEGNGFPETLLLSCQNCAVAMELTVEYQF